MIIKKLSKFFISRNEAVSSYSLTSNNIINSHIDKKCIIDQEALIEHSQLYGEVTVGARSWIYHAVLVGGKIFIGRNTSINAHVNIFAEINPVVIGNFCSIASNVVFQEYNHHFKSCSTYFMHFRIFGGDWQSDVESKGGIEVGNDVWIGTQSIILSGIKIGNGAVIGANSVVTSDIPPFAIAVGSPAKVIKYRFSEEIISKLEQIQWWNWELEKIKANRDLFIGELSIEKLDCII
jgi:virginiamycin A acetyltransferase